MKRIIYAFNLICLTLLFPLLSGENAVQANNDNSITPALTISQAKADAPQFAENYPKINSTGATEMAFAIKADKAGIARYKVLFPSQPTPSVEDLLDNASTASFEANTEKSVTVSPLSPDQAYVLHIILKDDEDNASEEVTSINFSTTSFPFIPATLDELTLSPESYFNGNVEYGHYQSGSAKFHYYHNMEWDAWNGFAYSNVTDIETPGMYNQYSAYVKHSPYENNVFAVAYLNYAADGFPIMSFTNSDAPQELDGFLICNNAYAYHAMKDGSDYQKKFGGEDGNDPDFFKVIIKGLDADGEEISSMDYYLADYRFSDNTMDYILDEWTWVDLSPLGAVCGLKFYLESTDNSAYAMRTPAFFCVDQFNGSSYDMVLEELEDQELEGGESVQLISEVRGGYPPYDYEWTPSTGLSSAYHPKPFASPEVTTQYTLKVTDSRGNIVEQTVTIDVESGMVPSTFEDMELADDTHWHGNSVAGGGSVVTMFSSGTHEFYNFHDFDNYNTWNGFAYANHPSNEYGGFADAFNNVVGGGYNSACYGVFYSYAEDANMKVTPTYTNELNVIKGMWVTNSAWAASSMENGDGFAKKFGGEDGNDPDYFKIIAVGVDAEGNDMESTEFYLADFRYEDNAQDYILKEWKWFDLSVLGNVKSVRFYLESTDVGEYGMNTPGYFCFDDFNGLPMESNLFQINNIPPKTMYKNGADAEVNLFNYFSCDNGITIKYNAMSDNTDLVKAYISENKLILKAQEDQIGETDIQIRATAASESLTTTMHVVVEDDVNVVEINLDAIRIFPNPASSQLNIITTETTQVSIYAIDGKMMKYVEAEKGQTAIDVANMDKGLYFVKLESKNAVKTEKVILK